MGLCSKYTFQPSVAVLVRSDRDKRYEDKRYQSANYEIN